MKNGDPVDLSEEYRADIQALADVRALDEWAASGRVYAVGQDPHGYWQCIGHLGATPDEARAKAAAWVRGLK